MQCDFTGNFIAFMKVLGGLDYGNKKQLTTVKSLFLMRAD